MTSSSQHPRSLPQDLTVLILTKDEELNLPYALRNVVGWARDVIVLDSGSADNTCSIATSMGARVYVHPFENYAKQRNYALQLPIETGWVMFLDADEYLLAPLKEELDATPTDVDANGFMMNRRFYFMGRWIRHGGYYPSRLLRLFRHGKGKVVREINEQFEVEGKILSLSGDFVDHNRKGLLDWLQKHLRYANFEAEQLVLFDLAREQGGGELPKTNLFGNQSERKQWIRQHIWNPLLPPLARPFMYYFVRYVLQGGFRDGQAGLIFHFLQGLWLHFVIDSLYLYKKQKAEGSPDMESDESQEQGKSGTFSAGGALVDTLAKGVRRGLQKLLGRRT